MNYKHLHYFWWVAKLGSVAKAGEQLHVTAHTISAQLGVLEKQVGSALFTKSGRNLEMTDAGKLAYKYAEDIFTLGSELQEALSNYPEKRIPQEFRVGVSDSMPKTIAYQLLEPATQLNQPIRIVCREWKLDSLLAELAAHRLDLVLAGAPIPSSVSVRAFNHRLGQSGVTFFAAPDLCQNLKASWPALLNDAPMLIPSQEVPLRHQFDHWCQTHNLRPMIIGEFDDSALMKAFGRHGKGIFLAPTIIADEIEHQYDVQGIGETVELREEFFAISVERRIKHPCVVAITAAAKARLPA